MFFFASSRVSLETFETLLKIGHQSAIGSLTSMTFPSFMTTRAFPKSSITCAISVTCEFIELEQFGCFYLRYPDSHDFNKGVNMFILDAMKTFHSFKNKIKEVIQFLIRKFQ